MRLLFLFPFLFVRSEIVFTFSSFSGTNQDSLASLQNQLNFVYDVPTNH